jgi:hypothetical protein
MKYLSTPARAKADFRFHGTGQQWRLFTVEGMVGVAELAGKLSPIIKALKTEGKKNAATISIGSVAHLAGKLQNLIDEWSVAPKAPQFLQNVTDRAEQDRLASEE